MMPALNKEPEASPDQVLRNMNDAVNEFVKKEKQFDDLTMLCLVYRGSSTAGD